TLAPSEPTALPSPGLAMASDPTPSPSASPRPTHTSTDVPRTDIVAISLAKDNRVAEVDPLTGRMVRMVDLSEPAGPMALASDGHSASVFKPQGKGSSIAVLDLFSGDQHEDIHFREADHPVAAAFSTDGTRAYVATAGSIVVTSKGKEYGRIGVGRQTSGVQVPRRV